MRLEVVRWSVLAGIVVVGVWVWQFWNEGFSGVVVRGTNQDWDGLYLLRNQYTSNPFYLRVSGSSNRVVEASTLLAWDNGLLANLFLTPSLAARARVVSRVMVGNSGFLWVIRTLGGDKRVLCASNDPLAKTPAEGAWKCGKGELQGSAPSFEVFGMAPSSTRKGGGGGLVAWLPPLLQEAAERPVDVMVIVICAWVYIRTLREELPLGVLHISTDTVFLRQEYIRILSSALSHASVLHIVFNTASLWGFGGVEQGMGSVLYFGTSLLLVGVVGVVACAIQLWAATRGHGGSEAVARRAVGYSGVLFAWMVVAAAQQQQTCPIPFIPGVCFKTYRLEVPLPGDWAFALPISFAPFASLLFTQMLIPNVSFVGHLAGVIAGFPVAWGWLNWLAPSLVLSITILALSMHAIAVRVNVRRLLASEGGGVVSVAKAAAIAVGLPPSVADDTGATTATARVNRAVTDLEQTWVTPRANLRPFSTYSASLLAFAAVFRLFATIARIILFDVRSIAADILATFIALLLLTSLAQRAPPLSSPPEDERNEDGEVGGDEDSSLAARRELEEEEGDEHDMMIVVSGDEDATRRLERRQNPPDNSYRLSTLVQELSSKAFRFLNFGAERIGVQGAFSAEFASLALILASTADACMHAASISSTLALWTPFDALGVPTDARAFATIALLLSVASAALFIHASLRTIAECRFEALYAIVAFLQAALIQPGGVSENAALTDYRPAEGVQDWTRGFARDDLNQQVGNWAAMQPAR